MRGDCEVKDGVESEEIIRFETFVGVKVGVVVEGSPLEKGLGEHIMKDASIVRSEDGEDHLVRNNRIHKFGVEIVTTSWGNEDKSDWEEIAK